MMVDVMTYSALRVIAFATFELEAQKWNQYEKKFNKGPNALLEEFIKPGGSVFGKIPFTFLGIFGLKDPIRKNVNGFV